MLSSRQFLLLLPFLFFRVSCGKASSPRVGLVGRQPAERRMRTLGAVKFHPRSDPIARLRSVLECVQIDALVFQ